MIGRWWLRQNCVQAARSRVVASDQLAVQIRSAKAVRNLDGSALAQGDPAEEVLGTKMPEADKTILQKEFQHGKT